MREVSIVGRFRRQFVVVARTNGKALQNALFSSGLSGASSGSGKPFFTSSARCSSLSAPAIQRFRPYDFGVKLWVRQPSSPVQCRETVPGLSLACLTGFVGVTHRRYPRQQRVKKCRANILKSFSSNTIAAPDVCGSTSAVGESRHGFPRRIHWSADTEPCLAKLILHTPVGRVPPVLDLDPVAAAAWPVTRSRCLETRPSGPCGTRPRTGRGRNLDRQS
jgi:hypothetical protein